VAAALFPASPQVANVHVPFLFKQAVDGLSGGATVVPLWGVAALTPATLLVGYGLARGGAALCNGARPTCTRALPVRV
jgi:ABC transporter ATM